MKNIHSSTRQTTPCRAVTITISRNKGVPVSAALSPDHSNILPAEEAMLGFGISGITSFGKPFSRMGVYGFETGIPRFKFALNFDIETGAPQFRQSQGGRFQIKDSEYALINWMQGCLFDQQMSEGDYFLKLDKINDLRGELSSKEASSIPQRSHFALERRLEASVDMVKEYMELQITSQQPCRQLRMPMVGHMISTGAIPADRFDQDGKCLLPLVRVAVRPGVFRAFAVNRFGGGLRVPVGHFREIKTSYVRAFQVADEMLAKGRPATIQSIQKQTLRGLRKAAFRHIEGLDVSRINPDVLKQIIEGALDALTCYYRDRTPEGDVVLWMPPARLTDQATREEKEVSTLFDEPMFRAISARPIQVINNFWTTGEFPEDGTQLFKQ